jgi:hypothetical protein
MKKIFLNWWDGNIMPVFIFNDRSLNQYYNDFDLFKQNMREFLQFYKLVSVKHSHKIYIFRNEFFSISVCNDSFRNVINNTRYFSSEQKRQFLVILDKGQPYLPDESAIPREMAFSYNNEAIPNTGLAESAYLRYMDESAPLYSISNSEFQSNILKVRMFQNSSLLKEQDVVNYFSIAELEQWAKDLQQPLISWKDVFDYIAMHFNWLELTEDVKKSLKKETFDAIICGGIIQRLDIINRMPGTQSEDEYQELDNKYWHGDRALFSDESESRKNDLKDKLTFLVNGKKTLCSYHGKISHKAFRIYMSSKPKLREKVYIVYIGKHL